MADILVVDDEAKMRHILSIMLGLKGHRVDEAGDGVAALERVREKRYDLLIVDLKMPRMDGLTFMRHAQELDPTYPVIFITAFGSVESAVEAMSHGAVDYLTKPFEEHRILLSVEKALKVSRIMEENVALRQELAKQRGDDRVVCVSPAMKKVMELADRVAQMPETTVMITGESGVGKEVVARFVHNSGSRAKERFVAVNCAAISPSLVESELFGHEKGAFTGADRRKLGKFEYADGGTLFLDEVGDLPMEAQAKLLRALQDRVVERVGGVENIKIDIRVICATNRDLAALVREAQFRQDLYYRLSVFPIHVPPLRERGEGVLALADFFINRFTEGRRSVEMLTEGARNALLKHLWPGNVRELANAMERAIILAGREGRITADTLSFLQGPGGDSPSPSSPSTAQFQLPPEGISLEELEQDLIRQALLMAGNNQSAAARLLGLTRSKLRSRLKEL